MKKKFEKIALLKDNMRTLFDKVKTEKRSLSEDELNEVRAWRTEIELLKYETQEDISQTRSVYPAADRTMFASRALAAVCAKRNIDEFGGFARDNSVIIKSRALTDTTAIANIIPTTIEDIITPLQKALILDKLGVKINTGVVGNVVYPTAAAIEATRKGENVLLTDTNIDLGKLEAKPQRIGLAIPWSNTALLQANQDMMSWTFREMMVANARCLNKWLLDPTDGVFKDKTAKFTTANGSSFSYKDIISLPGHVEQADAQTDETAAYVMTPALYAELKATPKDAGSGRFIIENGEIDGYPVLRTSYAKAETIGFGVWSNVTISQFGDINIVVDDKSKSRSNQTDVVMNSHWDITVLVPEAFVIGERASA